MHGVIPVSQPEALTSVQAADLDNHLLTGFQRSRGTCATRIKEEVMSLQFVTGSDNPENVVAPFFASDIHVWRGRGEWGGG